MNPTPLIPPLPSGRVAVPGYRAASTLPAQDICARMFGSALTFDYRMPRSQVLVRVFGELRQLSAGGGTISVLVTSLDRDGGGALEEFELAESDIVTFLEQM